MKITVPIKASPQENPLVMTSLKIAENIGAPLLFLHVVDDTPLKGTSLFHTVPDTLEELMEKKGCKILKDVMDIAKEKSIEVRTSMEKGEPVDLITRSINTSNISIMRSRIRSSPQNMGKVVGKVLPRIKKPVLLLESELQSFDRALLVITSINDFKEFIHGLKSLRKGFPFKKVEILFAQEIDNSIFQELSIAEGIPGDTRDKIKEGILRDTWGIEKEFFHKAKSVEPQLELVTLEEREKTPREVLAKARKLGSDILIMPSGKISLEILKLTGRPVILIP